MSDPAPSTGLFEAAADREALERAAAAAAPIAPERSDQSLVRLLAPQLRPAVSALLSSLADNKYLLGRRYAEWCTGAPLLEAAVAAAAMAQDELGHARSIYPLLRAFPEAPAATSMEERGWQGRATSAVACLDTRFASWSEFVATNLLVDTAFTTLLAAAGESSYEPLRQRARKVVAEERAHWVHAHGWTRRLAGDARIRPALERALAECWPHAATWFGSDDDPVFTALHAAGVLAHPPRALREALRRRVTPVLAEAALPVSLLVEDLPWSRWRLDARRLAPRDA
ncbi:MAG: phenylacetate-CoA oxygenase subunit PaaI [Chloroflexi bacterium]|nr:phenylacetate-CoA oxygenase subunit PaaI [Chloroflexota bacterium]